VEWSGAGELLTPVASRRNQHCREQMFACSGRGLWARRDIRLESRSRSGRHLLHWDLGIEGPMYRGGDNIGQLVYRTAGQVGGCVGCLNA
jgi:hypothetical protein